MGHILETLDKVDQTIINLLAKDGRMPFTTIATHVGVPEATARYRVNRLLDDGVIKCRAVLQERAFDHCNVEMITIQCVNSEKRAIAGQLSAYPQVSFVGISSSLEIHLQYDRPQDAKEFYKLLDEIEAVQCYTTRSLYSVIKTDTQFQFRTR